jgi:ATP-dependent DNA ligase
VKRKATFIKPMLLSRSEELPDGAEWVRELKFDGYRAVAVKSEGRVHLRSRNDNDFSSRYPAIVRALEALPDETVIDGEIVALDGSGRPSFNALQNGSSKANIIYYVFDLMLIAGTDARRVFLLRMFAVKNSMNRPLAVSSRRNMSGTLVPALASG